MMYRHNFAEVEAIRMDDLVGVLKWLKPGEFNFVSPSMVIVCHLGRDWYRAYFGVDYLVRDRWGVRPMTIDTFEHYYRPVEEAK